MDDTALKPITCGFNERSIRLFLGKSDMASCYMPISIKCLSNDRFDCGNRLMRAFWTYDLTVGICYLNAFALSYVGLPLDTEFIDAEQIDQLLVPDNPERWERIFTGADMDNGNLLENATVQSGPYKGTKVTLTGAVMARDSLGYPILISGVIRPSQSNDQIFMTQDFNTDGVWDWDMNTGEISFSDGYKKLLGYSPEDPFPSTYADWYEIIMHCDDRGESLADDFDLVKTAVNGNYFEKCIRVRKKDGSHIWVLDRGLILERNRKGHATRIVGYCTDINIISRLLDKSMHDAYTDPLTGLRNRAYLNIRREILESPESAPLSVLYVDVTCLKAANDYLGHDAGDEVIQKVANMLTTVADPTTDTVMRLGGDEFIIAITKCTSYRANMVVKTLYRLQEQNNRLSDEDINFLPIFFGIGAATLGEDGTSDLDSLINLADQRSQEEKNKYYREDRERITNYILKCRGVTPDFRDTRLGQRAQKFEPVQA